MRPLKRRSIKLPFECEWSALKYNEINCIFISELIQKKQRKMEIKCNSKYFNYHSNIGCILERLG